MEAQRCSSQIRPGAPRRRGQGPNLCPETPGRSVVAIRVAGIHVEAIFQDSPRSTPVVKQIPQAHALGLMSPESTPTTPTSSKRTGADDFYPTARSGSREANTRAMLARQLSAELGRRTKRERTRRKSERLSCTKIG